MLKIELDLDQPGVPEHAHELLSQMTEQIVTALDLSQTKGEILLPDGPKDRVVGSWVWE